MVEGWEYPAPRTQHAEGLMSGSNTTSLYSPPQRALRTPLLVLAVSALTSSPSFAQAGGVVLFVQGGRHSQLTDLAVGTGDKMGSGFSAGAGLTVMLGRSLALRGYVSRTSSDYRGPTLTVQDSSIVRMFYGGDLMLGFATDIGLAPYLFGGLGGVAIDPADSTLGRFSKFAGHLGAGFNYVIEDSRVTPFLESGFWVYGFDRYGFDRTLWDFGVSVGLALTVPF